MDQTSMCNQFDEYNPNSINVIIIIDRYLQIYRIYLQYLDGSAVKEIDKFIKEDTSNEREYEPFGKV